MTLKNENQADASPALLPNWLEPIEDAFLFPTERIDLQQDQPRSEFDEGIIDRIAKSVQENQGKRVGGTGFIHPLLVRWKPGAFDEKGNIKSDARVEVVAGETRYWAGLTAKLSKLPVIITDMTTEEAYDAAVTENILRGDLSEKDEGRMFLYLMNKNGWSTYKLAVNVYHDASKEGYIRNRVEMQKLNPVVARMVDKRPDTMTAARRIQTIKNEDTQKELVEFMLAGGNFEKLNEKIREIKGIVPSDKNDTENRKALKAAFPPKKDEAINEDSEQNSDSNDSVQSGGEQQTGNSSQQEAASSKAIGNDEAQIVESLEIVAEHLELVAEIFGKTELSVRQGQSERIKNLKSSLFKIENALSAG